MKRGLIIFLFLNVSCFFSKSTYEYYSNGTLKKVQELKRKRILIYNYNELGYLIVKDSFGSNTIGVRTEYSNNSIVKQFEIDNNENKTGFFYEYYPNKKLKSKGYFNINSGFLGKEISNGEQDSIIIISKINTSMNIEIGEWTFYNENGYIRRLITYSGMYVCVRDTLSSAPLVDSSSSIIINWPNVEVVQYCYPLQHGMEIIYDSLGNEIEKKVWDYGKPSRASN